MHGLGAVRVAGVVLEALLGCQNFRVWQVCRGFSDCHRASKALGLFKYIFKGL